MKANNSIVSNSKQISQSISTVNIKTPVKQAINFYNVES